MSAIYDHRMECQCRCDSESFEVIDLTNDEFALRIKEAIYI